MHRWHLDSKQPLSLHIAADARLSQTDYTDDQSWQLQIGQGDDAALALQTRYGGRVGLASLVPMWMIEGRIIYEARAYHKPPVLTAFAPGYLCVEADILPELSVTAEYWIPDSHSVWGSFTLKNTSAQPVSVRLDLYGHAVARSRELQIAILTLVSEENALYFGKVGNIDPVVIVSGGTVGTDAGGHVAPKVGRTLDVDAGGETLIEWAHAALPEMTNSIRRARYWLEQDFSATREIIERSAAALPHIMTGNTSRDATIAFAVQQAAQAFLRASGNFTHPSFVTARVTMYGYSPEGDGSDYIRSWSGQQPPVAYLLSGIIASAEPDFAEGIIRNFLQSQSDDGSIDWAPGIAGQRKGMLAMPVLARLTWRIYQQTANGAFIQEAFPGLLKFFDRWFREDVDHDGDGVPEWQDVSQTGYAGWPLFSRGGVDIRTIESPDMLAYLLSEAQYLARMAFLVKDVEAEKKLQPRIEELKTVLEDMWTKSGFAYRDRDSHTTPSPTDLLSGARADEEHLVAVTLDAPARLVLEAMGGASQKPQFSVTVSGLNPDGSTAEETIVADTFTWSYGRGTATTATIFSQVDRIQATGLSRVYRLNARTTGLESDDMNTLLPLITGSLTDGQVAQIVETIKTKLLKPNGLALYPTPTEPGADASGVWVFWNTLICEALFISGYGELAVDILRRLLRVQAATLREGGAFTIFYDEDDMRGKGNQMDLNGIVPVHLLMTAFGLTIQSDGTVIVAEGFPWREPVIVEQFGIRIERDSQHTVVSYPDGNSHTIPTGKAETLSPPQGLRPERPGLELPQKPEFVAAEPPPTPIRIEVEIEDDAANT